MNTWVNVVAVTATTTVVGGIVAAGSGFINPVKDYDPPWNHPRDDGIHRYLHWSIKPLSAFFFPSLFEEVLWRGIMIYPHPSTVIAPTHILSSPLLSRAGLVLAVHVLFHPVAGYTVWPRGREVFCDPRFLVLAGIVLGGATASFLVSGGSAYAAALTHGMLVALWRDFFGGEAKLMKDSSISGNDNIQSGGKKDE